MKRNSLIVVGILLSLSGNSRADFITYYFSTDVGSFGDFRPSGFFSVDGNAVSQGFITRDDIVNWDFRIPGQGVLNPSNSVVSPLSIPFNSNHLSFNIPVNQYGGLLVPDVGSFIQIVVPRVYGITIETNNGILANSNMFFDGSHSGNGHWSQQDLESAILYKSVNVTVQGGIIEARFTPGLGLSLSQAAQELGFDHFNWVQYVSLPKGFIVTDPVSKVDQPILDSILNYNADTHYYNIVSPHTKTSLPVSYDTEYFGDSKTPYLNEPLPTSALSKLQLWSPTSLGFSDSPSWGNVEPGFGLPTDFMSFSTALVGCDARGNVVADWAGQGYGVDFTWQSNGSRIENVVRESTIDDGTLPPIVSGGVVNVVQDFAPATAAPEPASLTLLGLGSLGLLAYGRRRRKQPAA